MQLSNGPKGVPAVILLAITGFCVYGFMASADASSGVGAFRTIYAAIAVGCLGGSGALIASRARN